MDLYEKFWGDDTDYKARAEFVLDLIDEKIHQVNPNDPDGFRLRVLQELIKIIEKEGEPASRLEINALTKEYNRAYPIPLHPD